MSHGMQRCHRDSEISSSVAFFFYSAIQRLSHGDLDSRRSRVRAIVVL